VRDNRGWSWLFHRGGMSTHTCPMRGRTCGRTGGLAGALRFGEQLASVGPIRRAMPVARHRLRRERPGLLRTTLSKQTVRKTQTPPHGRARPTSRAPPNGGNCTIRGATRRRHADRMLLMVQNPHPALRAEESQGELRPGVARITDRVAHQAHVSHVSSRWSALWGPHRPGPRPDVSRVLWRVS